MYSHRTEQCCPFIIISEDGTAVSIAAQRLCREERGGGNMTEGTGFLSVISSAKSLCTVFQCIETIFLCQCQYLIIVSRKSEQVYDYHGLRL